MPQYWVFGYASLMWRPGFRFTDSRPALLHGWHRSLCIYSHVHRGTTEQPGLVFGLDAGGACKGMAFRVEADDWDETVAYLRAREQVTSVYLERLTPIRLLGDKGRRRVIALNYVVDRNHTQYAGRLSDADLLRLIRQGQGGSGSCRDYVAATQDFLRQANWRDSTLERLSASLAKDA